MIKLVNVNKEYKIKKNKQKVLALNNINIVFPNTGFYSIIGRSGAGKTTLLNCLAGIDKVTSGEIYYNNVNICNLKGDKLDNYREQIGFIFQDYNLIKEYNVEQNISLSMEIQGTPKDEINIIVNDVLNKVGLAGYNTRKITELSGGEQQRVVIARALAKKSKVIFCDEPTGNLDEDTARELFTILKEISIDVLIVCVTHNYTLAKEYSDGVVKIAKGEVVENSIPLFDEIESSDFINNQTKNKLGLPFITKLCFEHYRRLFIYAFIVLLTFICSFVVFNVFQAVSNYDAEEAFINTLKDENKTILGISKYSDYFKIYYSQLTDQKYDYDYGLRYEEITEEDIEKIKADLAGKAKIYNSYNYVKSFDSLFGIELDFNVVKNEEVFNYHQVDFRTMLGFEDFNDFSMPLLYGTNPKEENEILIYDYMADNMLYHKCFDCEMEDLIGKTIYDKDQNLELKIAGIIKSNYQEYEYMDGLVLNDYYTIGDYYLYSLQTIFVNQALINKLDQNIKSVNGVYFDKCKYETYEILEEKKIDKITKLKIINDTDFEYLYKSDRSYTNGYVLTLTQVSNILGLDHPATEEEMQMLIDQLETYHDDRYMIGFYSIDYSGFQHPEFLGIVTDDVFNDNDSLHIVNETFDYESPKEYCDEEGICYITEYMYRYQETYYDFDGTDKNEFYIELNSDFSYAEEVLAYFETPDHDLNYYLNCFLKDIEYENIVYCIDDPLNDLILDIDYYLSDIAFVAKWGIYLSIFLIIVGIGGLCLTSIERQVYKIGILKSLGAKNIQICLSYIMFIMILCAFACIISIPLSNLTINIIDSSFGVYMGEPIKIFNIVSEVKSGYTILWTLAIAVVSSLFTYFVFTIHPPVMLIRKNKEL